MPPKTAADNEVIFECRGTLCILEDRVYVPLDPQRIGSSVLTLERVTAGKSSYEFLIAVETEGEMEAEQTVLPSLALQYHYPTGSVFWPSVVEGNFVQFGFRFAVGNTKMLSPEMAAQSFVLKYNICVYQMLTGCQLDASKDDQDEIDYISNAASVSADKDAAESVFEFVDGGFVSTGSGENTCFAESVQYNRALVMQKRGDGAYIQAHAFDTREGIADRGAEEFKLVGVTNRVTDALLTHSEQAMFLVDAPNSGIEGALRQLDLAQGVIVQSYTQPGTVEGSWIKSVKPFAKHMDQEPHLLSCISNNAAFAIDTRLDPRKCVVMEADSEFRDLTYATIKGRVQMTAHATSKNGYLVVGDSAGDVRMYTGIPGSRKQNGSGYHNKIAKTLIKLKAPILHLEVTGDGALVVVTTESRILVLDTRYIDDKSNKPKNGFEYRMGSQKPAPLALLPSPSQVMRMGGANQVKFSKATLEHDNQAGTEEAFISAACGSFVCTWSMKHVREAVQQHRAVVCSGKELQQPLVNIDVPLAAASSGQAAVCLLHPRGLSMQFQGAEKSVKKKGGFSFFDEK